VVQPVYKGRVLDWNNASLSIAVRGEYVDYNDENFAATGQREYNTVKSIMPAISFRPTPLTVLRLNYRFEYTRDIVGNNIGAALGPTRGLSFGISSYF